MKILKALIIETINERDGKVPVVPSSDTSATKTSNHLKKHFAAEKLPSWGSNPYADFQSIEHKIPAEHGDRLRNELVEQGWKFDNSRINTQDFLKDKTGHYTHDDGGHMVIGRLKSHLRARSRPVEDTVTVYGKKKAKRSDIPYYD
jgi:hypothetical protein